MRKILVALTVAVILSITSSAMASGVKVPKMLCIDMDVYDDKHQLALKPAGKIYDPTGSVKTYTITGRDRYGVISGSAYVAPNTNVLYATYSGSHHPNGIGDDNPYFFATYNLTINLLDADLAGYISNLFIPGRDPEWSIPEFEANLLNHSHVDIIRCNTLDASFKRVDQCSAARNLMEDPPECSNQ